MPSAVSGLTNQAAPSAGVVPSGNTRHVTALRHRYWVYMPPPTTATVLPSRAWAAADVPARTTTPAPSLPTGIDWSTRPATAFSAAGGTVAVTTGLAAGPETLAVLRSAPPNSSPWSDGLMGEASIRTMTSSGFGSGIATVTRDSSRMPSLFTVERSCRPVAGLVFVMCRLRWVR
jgi:hypothetical protein